MVSHAKAPCVPIPETEYLIGWTNGHIAIGFIRNPFECQDPESLPVVCQFGSWETTEQRSLRTGSVVMVKEYGGILFKDGSARKRLNFNEPLRSFVENGIPYPTIMATEWALVSKPKMFRTLGVLQKFHATYLAKNDLVLSGQAWDQEQNVDVSDDLFDSNIRKELQVDSVLVLTWIRLDENQSYGIYSTEPEKRRNFLLPAWMIEKFPQVKFLADTHWLEQVHASFV
ncbi:hypothetical protein M3Y97_00463900 [Aphelenchoides bicaudatus]|nr:hypothetical protein M3Y97_00463900 [Aphelenchoides bicaudatus]